jgi:pyrimidine operon attenuation protein/uracil phosphoribosyltransferase
LPQLYPVSERGLSIAETLLRFLEEEGQPCALVTSPATFRAGEAFLLIDDVLHTGRTLAQALVQVWAFSPPRVEVAVLVDRGHRLFPIVPDYVGLRLATTLHEYVEVRCTPKGWEVWLT